MLEAMAVILVFLVMASVLFASGRALNRQTVRTLEKNVARDGALTAVGFWRRILWKETDRERKWSRRKRSWR